MPDGTKPLPESMSTKIYDAIRHHRKATMNQIKSADKYKSEQIS